MNKQELRQWIIEFAKAPAYPEIIEAIDKRIDSVISEAIAEKDTEKIYEIDFAGFVKAKISSKGNVPTIEAAMNGWGNPIDPKDVTIDELPAPYQPKEGKEEGK